MARRGCWPRNSGLGFTEMVYSRDEDTLGSPSSLSAVQCWQGGRGRRGRRQWTDSWFGFCSGPDRPVLPWSLCSFVSQHMRFDRIRLLLVLRCQLCGVLDLESILRVQLCLIFPVGNCHCHSWYRRNSPVSITPDPTSHSSMTLQDVCTRFTSVIMISREFGVALEEKHVARAQPFRIPLKTL